MPFRIRVHDCTSLLAASECPVEFSLRGLACVFALVTPYTTSVNSRYRVDCPKRHVSVEVFSPVRGDAAGRPRCRLPARVMLGPGQRRPFVELLSPVVPEPVLPRLEALDDGMPGLPRMV